MGCCCGEGAGDLKWAAVNFYHFGWGPNATTENPTPDYYDPDMVPYQQRVKTDTRYAWDGHPEATRVLTSTWDPILSSIVHVATYSPDEATWNNSVVATPWDDSTITTTDDTEHFLGYRDTEGGPYLQYDSLIELKLATDIIDLISQGFMFLVETDWASVAVDDCRNYSTRTTYTDDAAESPTHFEIAGSIQLPIGRYTRAFHVGERQFMPPQDYNAVESGGSSWPGIWQPLMTAHYQIAKLTVMPWKESAWETTDSGGSPTFRGCRDWEDRAFLYPIKDYPNFVLAAYADVETWCPE